MRPATYSVNGANQYTSRTVPASVDILGIANPTASVLVNGVAANRKGEYFYRTVPTPNTSAPWFATNTVQSLYGAAPTESGTLFVPQTSESFTNDFDGNLTRDGRWDYTWDGENRLVKMESLTNAPPQSRLRLEFAYDYQGRRIWKKVTSLATSTALQERKFVYDGWNLVAVLNPQSAILQSFMWGLDLSGSLQGAGGVGGLLGIKDSGVWNCVTYDGNGNVAALVSASNGSVAARYEYGPFGELLRATGPMARANPFRFSTKYQDEETDLLYYGYRYYNASIGRWLSRDMIGEKGGKNLFGFVNNEPLAHWDKLGQFPNPFERQEPPPNNIDPPPSGPFSQCKVALQCSKAVSGQDHCGLVVDTGSGVYAIDGSGGTVNSRWVTPASSSDATSSWTDNPTSVCECLFGSIKPWNEQNYSRDQTQNNSNWNLKCLNKKCSVALDWGAQQKPIGYDGKHCAKWTWVSYGPPIGSCRRCDKIVDCPEDK